MEMIRSRRKKNQETRKVQIEYPWSLGIPRVSSPDPISLPITGWLVTLFTVAGCWPNESAAGLTTIFSRNRSEFRARVSTPYETRQVLIGNRPRSAGKREDKMRERREERIGGEVNQSVNKSVRCARVKLGAK